MKNFDEIKSYHFKTDLPFEFEIVDLCELFNKYRSWLTSRHRVDFHHILWFESGTTFHEVDFNPLSIMPDTLLFLNKGTIQKFQDKPTFTGKAILFTDSFFLRSENDNKYLNSSYLFNNMFGIGQLDLSTEKSTLLQLLKMMTAESNRLKDSMQADILRNFLSNFLHYAERELTLTHQKEAPTNKSGLNIIVQFNEMLEKHFHSEHLVAFYATEMALTEKRLNKATKSILGKTPKEIIDDRIILEAKRLLGHTDDTVKQICYDLGFEEPTFFVQYFKRIVKTTPLAFRESKRE